MSKILCIDSIDQFEVFAAIGFFEVKDKTLFSTNIKIAQIKKPV